MPSTVPGTQYVLIRKADTAIQWTLSLKDFSEARLASMKLSNNREKVSTTTVAPQRLPRDIGSGGPPWYKRGQQLVCQPDFWPVQCTHGRGPWSSVGWAMPWGLSVRTVPDCAHTSVSPKVWQTSSTTISPSGIQGLDASLDYDLHHQTLWLLNWTLSEHLKLGWRGGQQHLSHPNRWIKSSPRLPASAPLSHKNRSG